MMMMRRKPWLIALMASLLVAGVGVMAFTNLATQADARNASSHVQP